MLKDFQRNLKQKQKKKKFKQYRKRQDTRNL